MNQMSFSYYMQIKNIENLWLVETAVKRLKMHVDVWNFAYS